MRKKLLIAGGGFADIPLIHAAKKLGYYVITSGNRPEELGHIESDEYYPADFSDPEAMLNLAEELKINAICSCSNDFSAISSAYVAEQLDLPGHDSYETTKLLHHKDSYREFALSKGIPTPKAKGFSDLKSALVYIKGLNFPLIIKPVDLTGGKGISTIYDFSEANKALANAFSISKSKRVIIEEFIVGTRHGFSAFIWEGKVVFHFTDNEHYYQNQYLVSAASTPSIVSTKVINTLIYYVEKIALLLSLKTGVFHVQFILQNDVPIIIEICRRSPGDLYTKFVEYATGIDYPSWIIKSSAGLDCSTLTQREVNGFLTRHCIMAECNGTLSHVIFDPSIKNNIFNKFIWWQPGEHIDNFLTKKFGIVFLRFKSINEMIEKTEQMQYLIKAVVNVS